MADATLRMLITSVWKSEGIDKAKEDVDGLGKKTKETSTGIGASLSNLSLLAGGTALAAGAAVAKFTADSVKAFNNFEKGMAEVFTLMPNASGAAMTKMTADVRKFAVEAGRLPEEVVPALYQAISAGVPADNVFDFLEVSSNAALGGVTSLETAVDGISSVVNAYGADVLGAGKASDLMFTAVKLGKTTFEELASSLYNVVPTASALGVEFGNVTAALAAMTAQGTPTSVATTQLRQLLVELSQEGSKANLVFQQMAGMGFREFIAQGGNVQDALKLMEQAAQQSGLGLNDLFSSVEAGSAALTLTGRGTAAFTNALNEMDGALGATETAAATMGETTTQKMAEATAALNEFKLMLGEQIGPAVAEIAIAFTDIATSILPMVQEKLETIGFITGKFAEGLNVLTRSGENLERTTAGVVSVVGDEALTAAEKLGVLDDALNNMGTAGNIAGHGEEVRKGIRDVVKEVITGASDMLEARALLEEAGLDWNKYRLVVQDVYGELEGGGVFAVSQMAKNFAEVETVFDGSGKAADDAAVFIENLNETLEQSGRGLERYGSGLVNLDGTVGRLTATLGGLSDKQQEQKNVADKIAAIEAQEEALQELEAATKAQSAAWQAYVSSSTSAFSSSEGMFGDLFKAYDELEKAENTQINLNAGRLWQYGQTTEQIADLSSQLAADLSDDQKKAYQDILSTVDEGSAEWLSAYNALQGDLSGSARQGVLAQLAELQSAAGELEGSGLEAIYGTDARAAEEARKAIEEANAAIVQSYRTTAFEALLAQTGVNESTLAYGVGMGLLTQAEADARLEFTNTTLALTELASAQSFATASTSDQLEATQLLILGYADTAEEANLLAGQIKGSLSDSLLAATAQTKDLNDEIGKLQGDKSAKVDVEVNGIASLREAVGLMTVLGGKNAPEIGKKDGATTSNTQALLDVEARASGGPVKAGQPYIVGEEAAEMFVPNQDGYVLNARQTAELTGGGGSFNMTIGDIVIHSSTGNPQEIAAAVTQAMQEQRDEALRLAKAMGMS